MVQTLTMAFCLMSGTVDYHRLEVKAEKAALRRAHAEAQVLYTSALEAAKISAGPEHPDVARLLTRVALMMEWQGDTKSADPLYQEAIKMLDKDPVASPSELASALELYGRHFSARDETAEASKMRERANLIRIHLVEELAVRNPVPADAMPGFVIGSGIIAPIPIKRSEPEYSSLARLMRWQGTVLLAVEVGVDGTVRAPKLRRGVGLGLDEKAAESLLRWKFRPAIRDGAPVPVKANVEVSFRLP